MIDYNQLKYEIRKLSIYKPDLEYQLSELENLINGIASGKYLLISSEELIKSLSKPVLEKISKPIEYARYVSRFSLTCSTSVDLKLIDNSKYKKEFLESVEKFNKERFLSDFKIMYGVENLNKN